MWVASDGVEDCYESALADTVCSSAKYVWQFSALELWILSSNVPIRTLAAAMPVNNCWWTVVNLQ